MPRDSLGIKNSATSPIKKISEKATITLKIIKKQEIKITSS